MEVDKKKAELQLGEYFGAMPLFVDENHRGFIGLDRIYRIGSMEFKHKVWHRAKETLKLQLTTSKLDQIVDQIEAKARFNGTEKEFSTRFKKHGDGALIDIGDSQNNILAINCPQSERSIYEFYRPKKSRPFIVSELSEDPGMIINFVNFADLLDCYLVSALMIHIMLDRKPKFVLCLTGQKGSGKSTACRFISQLISPSSIDNRMPPKNSRDFIIAAKNSPVVSFDNLSSIPADISDTLCRITTGTSLTQKALYKDEDEYSVTACSSIIINAIPDIIERQDLADRTIVIELVPPKNRKSIDSLNSSFEEFSPKIRRYLVELAKRIAPKLEGFTPPNPLPRNIDLFKVICLMDKECMFEGVLIEHYRTLEKIKKEVSLKQDPVAEHIYEFFKNTPPELLSPASIIEKAKSISPNTISNLFPKEPRACGKLIARNIGMLTEMGLIFKKTKKAEGIKYLIGSTNTASTGIKLHEQQKLHN